jgi:hypothetical protein
MFRMLFTLSLLIVSSNVFAQCSNGVCYGPPRSAPNSPLPQVVQRLTRPTVQPIVRLGVNSAIRITQPISQRISPPTLNTTTYIKSTVADSTSYGSSVYAHCLREAQLQAMRGQHGHITGVAPGARMQGVGVSDSPNQPAHCVGRGQLLARACAQGRDGRWYWSAAYSR